MELKLTLSTIRPWRPGDETSLAHHANNLKIWQNVRDAFPHPYTMQDAMEWVRSASAAEPMTNFAIEIDKCAVGGIGIVLHFDISRRSAELGYWLGEEYWGRGVVSEAVRCFSEWVFDNFDLCRIYAGVFEWNSASARVLEKAGFEFEARLKKAVTKQGRTGDELLYAITR
jgi:RimJ/RimL family protein N-acetyltransferase